MKYISQLLIAFFLLICLYSCNNQSGDNSDTTGNTTGTTENTEVPAPVLNYGFSERNTYTNDYFGINITIPEGWTVQSREENSMLENLGRQNSGQTGGTQPASTSIEELQVIYLLVALQLEPGTAVDYNPGIQIIANNLTKSDTAVSATQYIKALAEQFGRFPNFTLNDAGISDTTLSGKTLAFMKAETKIGEVAVKQTYFATIIKNYAVQFTISYTNKQEKEALLKILDTLDFE